MKLPIWNGMEPVWDELAEMALFHGNPRQNNPVDEMSPFHPPALMPAGHKNRQALHRTGFGPKMMKKQPLPCQTCAAKAPPALTPGGHKNRQAPRPGPADMDVPGASKSKANKKQHTRNNGTTNLQDDLTWGSTSV